MSRALLLSGGIDSTALAWWKRPALAYTINYGHSAAEAEIAAAARVCRLLKCRHHVFNVDLRALGCGPLAGRRSSKLSSSPEWWPFRNQLLLTLAGMHAVQNQVTEIMVGTVSTDRRHADGKPQFLRGIDALMSHQEGKLRVSAPAASFHSEQLIRKSNVPVAALLHTHSCHRGNTHCCQCRGCLKRLELFERLGLTE